MEVGTKTENDKGISQLAIDGVNHGLSQDEYYSTIGYEHRDWRTVTFTTAGNKAFQFLVTGRNSSGRGYTLALDCLDVFQ